MSDTKGHTIQVVNGPAGPSLYLDDYRIAGPKPWGGGTVLHEFAFKDKDLIAAGVTLAATPAPLASLSHGQGSGNDTVILRNSLTIHATPAPLDGHQTPGEFHDYRVACSVCGEPGFLHVSWRPEKFEETP